MKKILILGAGVYQLPLIKKAREMGLKTIVVSIKGNYPGFKEADKVYYINTTDKNSLLEIANKEKIDAIVTAGTDVAVKSIGYICDKLHLPGVSFTAAEKVTNKYLFKKAIYGKVRTPKAIRWDLNGENPKVECKMPFMLKVVDSSGSRGIYKVKNQEEFNRYINELTQFTKEKYVLVEELLEGEEIGCEAIVANKRVIAILPHRKILTSAKTNIPIGHVFPSKFDKDILDDIEQQMRSAISVLGLDNCVVNADIILSDGKAFIIDFGARCGATGIPEAIKMSTGNDMYEVIIRLALGSPVDQFKWDYKRVAASKLLYSDKSGFIRQQNSIPIEEGAIVQFDNQIGDYVEHFQTGQQRLGMIVCAADNIDQVNINLENIEKKIDLTVE